MNLIVTCGCGDTDAFAKDAFSIIFPSAPTPPIVSQPGDFGRWQAQVDALLKSGAKFAYYLGDDELWDLKKGVRVA